MTARGCEGRTAYASPHFVPVAPFPCLPPVTDQQFIDSMALTAPDSQDIVVVATPTSVVTGSAPERASAKPRPWLIRHWQLPVALIMLVLAYVTLRGHLPSMTAVGRALGSADIEWIIIAAACEVVSLSMFARQQRRLLAAMGVRMSIARATAVTYARSALAISMPAGSAVSAGFAFSQYRRSGATNDKAAAVMVLSGLTSVLGLGVLYVAGVLGLFAAEPAATTSAHPALLGVLGGVAAVIGAAWLIRRRIQHRQPSTARRSDALALTGGRLDRIRITARDTINAWRSLRRRDWAAAGVFAVVNWLADLLCLASAARAFALPVGLFTIATMYLGVQIVRQLPITPGGIGLIETGLLAGLTHAGAGAGAAAAVVLTYRVLSCWFIIPLGGAAWLALRARPKASPPVVAGLTLAAAEPSQLSQ